MTKEKFLKRCETAWDAGYINKESIKMLRLAVEYTSRLQWWQADIAEEAMSEIQEESKWRQLATFSELYKCVQLAYLLCHPCDECAENPNAWHTRWWFCNCKK